MANGNSLYSGFLGEYPQAAYGLYAPRRTMPQQNYWSGRYGDLQTQYMAELGRQINLGGQPTLTWEQYLQQYPWLREWSNLRPGERGQRPTTYAPRMRWLF